MPLPRKRPGLDTMLIEHENEPVLVVRDPEGLLDSQIVLRMLAAIVWDLLDGERDANDVQEFIARLPKGALIPTDVIAKIVEQLDEICMLESPRLEQRRREAIDAYAKSASRPARFSGEGGYAGTADALSRELDSYFRGEHGAGAPAAADGHVVRGAIAPHIDFRRGGPCYTHAYRRLAEASPADVYVILAVAHASPEAAFVPSTKSYETPLGAARVDRPFLDELLRRTKRHGLEHERFHAHEHSAEFQAVFLRHALRHDFTVVPILCSRFDRYCSDRSPSTAPEVEDYLGALRETIQASGRRVCIVAGVDFAHVGPRFGDPDPVDDSLVQRMMEGDKRSLAHVASCDAEGFWASVMQDGNWRKVCGLSATYAALRLLAGSRGELLRYTYAPDPAGGLVSFASAVFR